MMGIRQPAILTQKAVTGIGNAAVTATKKYYARGCFQCRFRYCNGIFTLKFIVDFLPGIQE